MRAGIATGMMALMLAAPVRADVKAGVDAWQQGDHAKAVAEWRPLAEAGDADAQFNLGQAYKLGRGVPGDMGQALDWFRKAAAQGHARAADNYGLLLFQQGKRQEALPYIRKSAEQGEPRAQYILGTAMFNGDIVPKDWVTAYAMMTRAAAQGLSQASTSLAEMDRYIPESDRVKGQAIAARMGQGEPAKLASAPVATDDRTMAPPPAAPVKPAAAPPVAAAKPTAPKAEAQKAPPPPVKAKPAPALAKTEKPLAMAVKPMVGGYRLQLGAFREEPRARALWGSVRAKLPGLSAYYVTGGGVTRLQAGPVGSAVEAAKLCDRVKAGGVPCVVKPG